MAFENPYELQFDKTPETKLKPVKEFISLCIRVPRSFYLSLEKFKYRAKEKNRLIIPTNYLVHNALITLYGEHSSKKPYKYLPFIDSLSKEYANNKDVQNVYVRLCEDDYVTIDSLRLSGVLRGYEGVSLNSIVSYAIYRCYVTKHIKDKEDWCYEETQKLLSKK